MRDTPYIYDFALNFRIKSCLKYRLYFYIKPVVKKIKPSIFIGIVIIYSIMVKLGCI
ncbi:hypothetical protein GCM10025882_35160 [Acinetobacter gyllenbergii]|nr:hypothetical protein GCM10025882_35160 [Acinetobacter gyllenbergii]